MDRPNHIDLGSNDSSRAASAASRLGLPSPRIKHFDGDVPPSLSPLDAFAAHSRRLAKELEETRVAGQRRTSRLPPQIVTESLNQHQANRPAIFRSLSGNSQDDIPPVPQLEHESAGHSPAFTDPISRPSSAYPLISHVRISVGAEGKQEDGKRHQVGRVLAQDNIVPTSLHQNSHPYDFFDAPTTESPVQEETSSIDRKSFDVRKRISQADSASGLVPPSAAFARARLCTESSEDDYASSNAGSFFSQVRKLSSSSGMSIPRSPASPAVAHERTSSNNSATSLAGHRKVPSHLNFSRPRSAASSLGKIDSPTKLQHSILRKASHTSEYQPRTQQSFEDTRSVMSDGCLTGQVPSYTHSSFSLSRGGTEPASAVLSGLSTPHFQRSEPVFPSTPPLNAHAQDSLIEPSPRLLHRSSHDAGSLQSDKNSERDQFSFEFIRDPPALQNLSRRPSSSHADSNSIRSVGSAIGPRPSTTQGLAYHGAQKIPDLPPIPGSVVGSTQDGQSRSSRSNSTVRPTTSRSISNYQSLSADEHVTKAIELHQYGDLKESTYHLRIAARQDHPTGMLLYALACRHGWGMRSNQKEGVAWLKKAVDIAMLEVADDENSTSNKPKADFMEKKAHRAQFALSIYELGISHLNGWGVEQDKALALRCFEIAGTWGDPDALSEAGLCYSEGIGCKKDLKKAARFYRMAADKGVSMVGNSWIYKDKYNDQAENKGDKGDRESRAAQKASGNEKVQVHRSKSKTRSIFGRKRSVAVPASS